MNRRILIYIIAFMGVALAGLVTLQLRYIGESYELRSLVFDQLVNSALAEAVKKTEKEEVMDFVKTKITTTTTTPKAVTAKAGTTRKQSSRTTRSSTTSTESEKIIHQLLRDKDRNAAARRAEAQERKNAKAALRTDVLNHTRTAVGRSLEFDSLSLFHQEFDFDMPDISFTYGQYISDSLQHALSKTSLRIDSVQVSLKNTPKKPSIPRQVIISGNGITILPSVPPAPPVTPAPEPPAPPELMIRDFFDETDKSAKREQVFQELATEMHVMRLPLRERVRPEVIDSIITQELHSRKLSLPYELRIRSNTGDSVYFTSNTSLPTGPKDNVYQASLFEEKDNPEKAIVTLYFPKKEDMLMKGMGPAFISSGLLVMIMLFCFGYTIYAIVRQKKLSEMKNDFINNMTHEFKTPVSTIMLASEALKDPQVSKDEERLTRLATIIYDENIRMSEHVERVLNMATMETGELKMVYHSVDLHELIAKVISQISIQLDARNIEVICDLKATVSEVYADEMHLKNIIFNLLDNANKYSAGHTSITIRSGNTPKGVWVSVSDQGIGMSREQMKKIFKAFYRVPTGNIHNVKGFGLGLHYVHTMITRMNGSIQVKSEAGKGSEFTIHIPFQCK